MSDKFYLKDLAKCRSAYGYDMSPILQLIWRESFYWIVLNEPPRVTAMVRIFNLREGERCMAFSVREGY